MRLALIGHSCGPGLGSEPGLTWNLAWTAARTHEVHVLTHAQHRDAIERELASDRSRQLHVHFIRVPRTHDPWDPTRGERGIRAHYLLWQRVAARSAEALARDGAIDLAHHVSFGTVGVAPLLADLPVPVVWGPLGGGELIPRAFLSLLRPRERLAEVARWARVLAIPSLPGMRRMVGKASAILSCNEETTRVLRRCGARRVRSQIDCGLPEGFMAGATTARVRPGPLRVLWAGRFEPRKGMALALPAVARAGRAVELTVAGDGPSRAAYEATARQLDIADRVRFIGRVPWSMMPRLYDDADVFLFTSLRDRFGTILLEAMGRGLPVVALDCCGVRALVPDDAAVKIPLTSIAGTVDALAEALRALSVDEQRRLSVAEAALRFARAHGWDDVVRQFENVYAGVLQAS